MIRSIQHYAERRERLVRLAALQRDDLIAAAGPWSRAARSIDSGIARLRASPYPPSAMFAMAAALMIVKPKLVSRWARWIWFGVKMYQSVRTQKRMS
ncbi:MAG: YqjK family protein [Burkholderiales bacterium]